MAFERRQGVLLVVHNHHEASDADWAEFLRQFSEHRPEAMLAVLSPRFPGPTATQRQQMAATLNEENHDPKIVFMTDVALHRHAVTAFRWLGVQNITAFSFRDFDDALTDLGWGDVADAIVDDLLADLVGSVGALDILGLVAVDRRAGAS